MSDICTVVRSSIWKSRLDCMASRLTRVQAAWPPPFNEKYCFRREIVSIYKVQPIRPGG